MGQCRAESLAPLSVVHELPDQQGPWGFIENAHLCPHPDLWSQNLQVDKVSWDMCVAPHSLRYVGLVDLQP